MRIHVASLPAAAALLSLLCGATTSCLPRLPGGPRDTGGTYLILAVRADPAALEQSVRLTKQVIETRCDALGIYCKVEREGGAGSDRIRLRVSGERDFPRVKSVLLAEGRLELRPVASPPQPAPLQTYRTREEARAEHPDHEVIFYEDRGGEAGFIAVEREPLIAGPDVSDARAQAGYSSAENYMVVFTLKPEAARRFGAWTGANEGRYVAVVLNGRTQSAPYIRGPIADTVQISGQFTKESAEDLALTLRSGSLPVRLEVLEEGRYKP